MKIKCRLYEIRMEQEISLERLSNMTGVSKSTLHAIENMQRDPRVSTALLISKALNVSISDLFYDTE